MTVPSGSPNVLSAVSMDSVAILAPGAKVIVRSPSSPASMNSPVSLTDTVTSSSAAVLPVRLRLRVTASPSLTAVPRWPETVGFAPSPSSSRTLATTIGMLTPA